MADTPQSKGEELTLERLFASPSLNGPSPRSLAFSPDGSKVTFLKPRESDASRLDLWAFDVATGEQSMLVDSTVLDPDNTELSEEEKALRERKRIAGAKGIVDYDWDRQGRYILVPSGGDVWLVDVTAEGTPARQITSTDAFEYDARLSPGGRYVSFIRDGALYAVEVETGLEMRLSPEAEPDKAISYGVAEFVAQEEMSRYTGYWWSSDESHVAFTRVDESTVDIIPRFDIAADKVTVIDQRYPRAGRPNAIVGLFVRDMETGTTRQLYSVGPDTYLARVRWTGGHQIWFQTVDRDQTEITYHRSDGPTWRVWSPFKETQRTWVNLSNDFDRLRDGTIVISQESYQETRSTPVILPDGSETAVFSKASGFRHLYLMDPNSGELTDVTGGPWVMSGLESVDEQEGYIYFTGFKDTPLEQHLYRLRYKWDEDKVEAMGAKQLPGSLCIDLTPQAARVQMSCPMIERITPLGAYWGVTMSPDGKTYIGRSSSPSQPTQTGLYAIDGTLITWIEENRLDETHPYFPYLPDHTVPEYGTLTAEDGQTLFYSIQKPPGFDPTKTYPAIVEVYGGPHVQTVDHDWESLSDQYLTRQGFIVFRLDNRGAWNRGKAFEDVIYRRTGGPEVADQLLGVAWLKSQPFVDPDRVAIQGWSYGGYMTLMTLLQAPEGTFAAAVAGAPVTDWTLYDTFYTERYMDTPQDNAEGYTASSVFPYAENLASPLLLIHGMADDNVTFDNSTRLMAEFQRLGKQFELMTYPGQRHGIRGEALQVHLMRTRMAFLKRYLKP